MNQGVTQPSQNNKNNKWRDFKMKMTTKMTIGGFINHNILPKPGLCLIQTTTDLTAPHTTAHKTWTEDYSYQDAQGSLLMTMDVIADQLSTIERAWNEYDVTESEENELIISIHASEGAIKAVVERVDELMTYDCTIPEMLQMQLSFIPRKPKSIESIIKIAQTLKRIENKGVYVRFNARVNEKTDKARVASLRKQSKLQLMEVLAGNIEAKHHKVTPIKNRHIFK